MKSYTLLSIALAAGFVSAQDIGTEDFPEACINYCSPVVAQSQSCDTNGDDDDSQELDCLCNGQGMEAAIRRCDACTAPFRIGSGGDDDDDGGEDFDDINQLLNACGFSSTTLAGAPTPTATTTITRTSTDDDGDTEVETITSALAPLPSGVQVTTSTFTTTSTDDDGDVETEVDSVTLFSGASVTPTAAGGRGGSGGSGGSDSNSPNVAMQTAAPILGAGAAMLMGAFAAM